MCYYLKFYFQGQRFNLGHLWLQGCYFHLFDLLFLPVACHKYSLLNLNSIILHDQILMKFVTLFTFSKNATILNVLQLNIMYTYIISLFTVHFNNNPTLSKPHKLSFPVQVNKTNIYAFVPSQPAPPYVRQLIRILLKELRFSQMFRHFRHFIEHKFPYHIYNSPKIM